MHVSTYYLRIYYVIHASVYLYKNVHIGIRGYTTSYMRKYIYTMMYTSIFDYTHQHNQYAQIPHNVLDIKYN